MKNRCEALPAGLYDAWDFTLERQTTEAQPADAELAEECAGATAELAAVVLAALELGLLCVLDCFCSSRHIYLLRSLLGYARNGMPKCLRRTRALLSSAAVVTMVTFIPFSFSTFE